MRSRGISDELRLPCSGRHIPHSEFRVPDSHCGCSSMVEQQPSKLMTRVRFPSPASAATGLLSHVATTNRNKGDFVKAQARAAGPPGRELIPAAVAQSVERVLGKDEVTSSSLVSSSASLQSAILRPRVLPNGVA